MRVVLSGVTENDSVRGVERYVLELARCLARNPCITELSLLCGDWQGYYDPLAIEGVRLEKVVGLKNKKISRHFFHFWTIRRYFKRADIVHVCNTLPIFNPDSLPFVITIHDLAEFFVPEKYGRLQRYYRRFVANLAATQSKRIVTVSEFSKDAIAEHLNIPRDKIDAVYNGCDHLRQVRNAGDCGVAGRYVLYWGVAERTKGLSELVAAMKIVRKNAPDLRLVIAGKKGNAWPDVQEDVENSGWIDYLGYVDDPTLVSLIRSASVVAFPSVYEGFGFPAVEAFIYNDNVVTSSTTALGEISRDFARQVDPASVESIAEGVMDLLISPRVFSSEDRESILGSFSWEECATSCVSAYKQALNS